MAVFVANVEQHRRRRVAIARKQKRLGAWHDEPLVICIGDGDVANQVLLHRDKQDNPELKSKKKRRNP